MVYVYFKTFQTIKKKNYLKPLFFYSLWDIMKCETSRVPLRKSSHLTHALLRLQRVPLDLERWWGQWLSKYSPRSSSSSSSTRELVRSANYQDPHHPDLLHQKLGGGGAGNLCFNSPQVTVVHGYISMGHTNCIVWIHGYYFLRTDRFWKVWLVHVQPNLWKHKLYNKGSARPKGLGCPQAHIWWHGAKAENLIPQKRSQISPWLCLPGGG